MVLAGFSAIQAQFLSSYGFLACLPELELFAMSDSLTKLLRGEWHDNSQTSIETSAEPLRHRPSTVVPTDPTTASIDALRQAVVAQTALLRELGQQVRLSFEAQQAEYLSQQFEVAKQLAALAERLEGLADRIKDIQNRCPTYLQSTPAPRITDEIAKVEYPGRFTGALPSKIPKSLKPARRGKAKR